MKVVKDFECLGASLNPATGSITVGGKIKNLEIVCDICGNPVRRVGQMFESITHTEEGKSRGFDVCFPCLHRVISESAGILFNWRENDQI